MKSVPTVMLKRKHEASKIKTANLYTYLNLKISICLRYKLKTLQIKESPDKRKCLLGTKGKLRNSTIYYI